MDEEFEEQYKLSSERNKISSLLQSYHLSEMINPNIFTYHRVCLTYYSLRVVFVILLPVDYPSKYPIYLCLEFLKLKWSAFKEVKKKGKK